jgi:hypothetical protein
MTDALQQNSELIARVNARNTEWDQTVAQVNAYFAEIEPGHDPEKVKAERRKRVDHDSNRLLAELNGIGSDVDDEDRSDHETHVLIAVLCVSN